MNQFAIDPELGKILFEHREELERYGLEIRSQFKCRDSLGAGNLELIYYGIQIAKALNLPKLILALLRWGINRDKIITLDLCTRREVDTIIAESKKPGDMAQAGTDSDKGV